MHSLKRASSAGQASAKKKFSTIKRNSSRLVTDIKIVTKKRPSNRKENTHKGVTLNPLEIPREWFSQRQLPLPPLVDIRDSFEERLPKVYVKVHSGKNLLMNNVFLSLHFGEASAQKFKTKIQRGNDPVWEQDCTLKIEKLQRPWVCFVNVKSISKVGSRTFSCFMVDIKTDLGMLFKGDYRRWSFKLDTQGEIELTFIACGDLQFPVIAPEVFGQARDGLRVTPKPSIMITIYQAVGLSGHKVPSTYCEAILHTSDLKDTVKLNRSQLIMRTALVHNSWNPYWNTMSEVQFKTKADEIIIYMFSPRKNHAGIVTNSKIEIVKLDLQQLKKLATGTETRSWFPVCSPKHTGFLGIGFRALDDFIHSYDLLPDSPEEVPRLEHKDECGPLEDMMESLVLSEESIPNELVNKEKEKIDLEFFEQENSFILHKNVENDENTMSRTKINLIDDSQNNNVLTRVHSPRVLKTVNTNTAVNFASTPPNHFQSTTFVSGTKTWEYSSDKKEMNTQISVICSLCRIECLESNINHLNNRLLCEICFRNETPQTERIMNGGQLINEAKHQIENSASISYGSHYMDPKNDVHNRRYSKVVGPVVKPRLVFSPLESGTTRSFSTTCIPHNIPLGLQPFSNVSVSNSQVNSFDTGGLRRINTTNDLRYFKHPVMIDDFQYDFENQNFTGSFSGNILMCKMCKAYYDESQLKLLVRKPFCEDCYSQVTNRARERGVLHKLLQAQELIGSNNV